MRSYAEQKAPGRSAIGFAITVALHVVLIWALLNGLGTRMVDVIKGPLVTKILSAQKQAQNKPPPPPPPELLKPPPPFIPTPQVDVQTPDTGNAISAATSVAPPKAAPPPPPAPVVADTYVRPVAIGGGKPEYPQSLIDDEVEGSAQITCTVDTDGSTSDCTVTGVSGSALFGRAALDFAKTNKFRPATHNGVPVKTRAVMPFKFKLE
jgi:protein TonB